eukprot:scaffold13088_cov33-Cyclotella_meneghiniana.AAC.5
MGLDTPPKPSSPGSPAARRSAARWCSSLVTGSRMEWRTRAARVEERGHPWLVPSSMEMVDQDPSARRIQTSPGSL